MLNEKITLAKNICFLRADLERLINIHLEEIMENDNEQNQKLPQLFIPPQKLESPYKAGEINPNTFAADRVEVEMPEKRFQPPQEKNPDFYTTPEDYQKNTGRPLISLAYFESRPLIQRSSLQITGKRIGDKFVEQNGELFW